MVRRAENDPGNQSDERLGEAIEKYLALAEEGNAPDPEAYAARYPGLEDELREALDGLAMVRGLVGEPGISQRLETGRRIAGYRIVREIGRGGMGVVYEAVHVDLDRPVALKVLGTHSAPDSTGRRRFLNEAKTAAGLHHTHIVPVFDVGQVGGLCYYAMQRIEGCGLDRLLKAMRRDRPTAAGSVSLKVSRFGRSAVGQTTVTYPGNADPGLSWSGSEAASGRGNSRPLKREAEEERPTFEPPRGAEYYRWVANIGRQAAEALAHAHRRGVIHRDIKPSNLLVDARGSAWVADFGLARRLADPGMTQTDSLLGTPRYMSPEQARSGQVEGRTDVYSLGATLFELLTLRPPFEGKTAAELVQQITGKEPLPPRKYDPRVPRDLETIVLKAMAKRPSDRYAGAAELADDLQRFLNVEPVNARRIGPVGRAWRFARRHPGISMVSGTAALVVLSVATYAHMRVLMERNDAVKARNETEKANQGLKIAKAQADDAMRRNLLSTAQLVRTSAAPNRRERGLDLVKQAAQFNPDPTLVPLDPGLKTQLRDEAVEFLAARNVEPRQSLSVGRVMGLALLADSGAGGERLATLLEAEKGWEFQLWDAETKKLVRASRLPVRVRDNSNRGQDLRFGGGRGPFWQPHLALAGRLIAVVWPDGQGVRLFDAATGEPSGDIELPADWTSQIVALHATPEQRIITTVADGAPVQIPGRNVSRIEFDGYRVLLWSVGKSGGPLAVLAESHGRNESGSQAQNLNRMFARQIPPLVAVGVDGKSVAIGWAFDSKVAFWDAATGKPDGEPIDTQGDVSAVAIGPDGLVATAGRGQIRLWDLATRKPLPGMSGPQGNVGMLRFSADPVNPLLAVVSPRGLGIDLWDPTAGTLVASVPTSEPVHDLSFSFSSPQGGQMLAAALRLPPERPRPVEPSTTATNPGANALPGAEQQTAPASPRPPASALVWEIVEPVGRTRLRSFEATPHGLAFCADGLLAIAFADFAKRRPTPPGFWSVGQCPTSVRSLGGAKAGEITEMSADPAPGSTLCPVAAPTTVNNDGSGRLLLTNGLALAWLDPETLETTSHVGLPSFRRSSGDEPAMPRPGGSGSWIRAVSTSADGRAVALLKWNEDFRSDVLIWRAEDPATVHRVEFLAQPPPAGPNGQGRRGTSGRPPGGPPGGGPPRGWLWMALSPQADRLYLIAMGGQLQVWSLDGSTARRIEWSTFDGVSALALSSDGRMLGLGERSGSVILVDTNRGTILDRLPAAESETPGEVKVLAFGPAGHELAVGSEQGTIRLWALNGRPEPIVRLAGHRGSITALAFDPSGRRLASAGADRAVEVWDLHALRLRLGPLGLGW